MLIFLIGSEGNLLEEKQSNWRNALLSPIPQFNPTYKPTEDNYINQSLPMLLQKSELHCHALGLLWHHNSPQRHINHIILSLIQSFRPSFKERITTILPANRAMKCDQEKPFHNSHVVESHLPPKQCIGSIIHTSTNHKDTEAVTQCSHQQDWPLARKLLQQYAAGVK